MRRASALVASVATALACAASADASRIEIPKIRLAAPVGTTSNLADGPGFYPGSGRPGDGRTVAIAGHRTTHTRPFYRLNELRRGDLVRLWWHGTKHVYRVSGTRVVDKEDWRIVRELGAERLVLTACHPRGSSSKRIVAFAWPLLPLRRRD